MAGTLYVKLDASYDDDPKIIEAGEKAELLYVRSLCLAKRFLSDGFIADAHLPRFGLSSVNQRAKRLCEVGLWERDDDAGGYWIVSWLKHNNSAAKVEEVKHKRKQAGSKGGKQSAKQDAQANDEQTYNPEERGVEERGVEEPPYSPPEGDEQQHDPPPADGESLELVGVNGFPTEPAEGKTYAYTLGQWLSQHEKVKFVDHRDMPGGKKSDNYRVLLDEALERIGDEKVKAEKVAMQIIADLHTDLCGEPLLASDEKAIRRQIRNRHPAKAIYAVVAAIERAIDEGEDGSREKIAPYVRAVMDGTGNRATA